MKVNEFKSAIKQIIEKSVHQEVSKQLPKLLFELLKQQLEYPIQEQKLVKKQTILSSNNKDIKENDLLKEEMAKNSEFNSPTVPQKQSIKRYAKDPKLNAILNETVPGLPSTQYGDTVIPIPDFNKVGVSDGFMSEIREILTESESPNNIQSPITNQPAVDLSNLFNKNFKAILDKSKKIHGGNSTNVIQSW